MEPEKEIKPQTREDPSKDRIVKMERVDPWPEPPPDPSPKEPKEAPKEGDSGD
jgi:hypothetical protein